MDLLEAEQPKSQTHASELSVSPKDAEAQAQQNSADFAAPELSRHPTRESADEKSLLIHIPGNEASPGNTPAQQSPALQSPNRHIERLKEQVTQSTDTPWPGLYHISSPTTQKAQMPWPGLEMSQTSTTEAEGPTLVRTGSDSPPDAYSPTWVQAEGAHSPDSPLSLSEAVSRRASRAKRGRQRTYFNSSRSISSAESSPRAPAAPAAEPAASLAAHSLRSYVRSPRWAEQPGNSTQSPQVCLCSDHHRLLCMPGLELQTLAHRAFSYATGQQQPELLGLLLRAIAGPTFAELDWCMPHFFSLPSRLACLARACKTVQATCSSAVAVLCTRVCAVLLLHWHLHKRYLC